MKQLPILFSAPMVRALLDGSKTQTRRAMRKQFPADAVMVEIPATDPIGGWVVSGHSGLWWDDAASCIDDAVRCPYGQPGDRLWVRETFYAWGRWETRFSAKKGRDEWHFIDMTLEAGKSYLYPASDQQPQPIGGKRNKGGVTPTWWKRPAIQMPRAASRITLEITGVRVERLQDISEADAREEGAKFRRISTGDARTGMRDWWSFGADEAGNDIGAGPSARDGYELLWESINGPGSWDANPWVWVVSFKRVESA